MHMCDVYCKIINNHMSVWSSYVRYCKVNFEINCGNLWMYVRLYMRWWRGAGAGGRIYDIIDTMK